MAAVQHGKAQDVGLIVHHLIELQQREILQSEQNEREDEEREQRVSEQFP